MQVKVKAKRKRDIIPEREEDSKVARGGITYIFFTSLNIPSWHPLRILVIYRYMEKRLKETIYLQRNIGRYIVTFNQVIHV